MARLLPNSQTTLGTASNQRQCWQGLLLLSLPIKMVRLPSCQLLFLCSCSTHSSRPWSAKQSPSSSRTISRLSAPSTRSTSFLISSCPTYTLSTRRSIPTSYSVYPILSFNTINAFEQLSVKNAFIRGSVIRYVQVPREAVDTELLQDAARREAMHVAAQRDTTVISSK